MRPHRVDVALVAYDAIEEGLRVISMTLELKPAHCAMIPWNIGVDLGGECGGELAHDEGHDDLLGQLDHGVHDRDVGCGAKQQQQQRRRHEHAQHVADDGVEDGERLGLGLGLG